MHTTAPTTGFPPIVADMQMVEAVRESQINAFPSNLGVPLPDDDMTHFHFDFDPIAFEDIMDYLPMEGGLDNQMFLDSIFGTANNQ
jgi:transcription elongation factor SPT5